MTKCVLISVHDKTGIVEFAKVIAASGYKIISTGGTAKALRDAGVAIVPIQEITGNPESFDGRMKTISFQIESGILFDRANPKHVWEAKKLNIQPIDLVVCNLYPFEAKPELENIDVGGPTMVRAAAKNHASVLVAVDPKDYEEIGKLIASGGVDLETRKKLAAKAFYHLSFYDAQVARWLSSPSPNPSPQGRGIEKGQGKGTELGFPSPRGGGRDPFPPLEGEGKGGVIFPREFVLPGRKAFDLRYGENPHQAGAIYFTPGITSPLSQLQKLSGRDLSLTNVTDINAGIEAVRLFNEPAAVVIKHNNPCGIALGATISQALSRAIEADAESAFGGVIVLNQPMSQEAANLIAAFKDENRSNIDIVAAPEINPEAVVFLKSVRKSMGIYSFGKINSADGQDINFKWLDGGFALQTADQKIEESFAQWKVATKLSPTPKQLEQMQIAWKFISRIKSNAVIVVDKDLPMTRGIGTGQTSRVRATRLALEQAANHTQSGAILASDSFFPFDDSIKLAAKSGIAAIVQQGGSVNDQASIKAADEAGIAMVFTGRRAFWH